MGFDAQAPMHPTSPSPRTVLPAQQRTEKDRQARPLRTDEVYPSVVSIETPSIGRFSGKHTLVIIRMYNYWERHTKRVEDGQDISCPDHSIRCETGLMMELTGHPLRDAGKNRAAGD